MPFVEADHLRDQIFQAPGAKPRHYATKLHTLSLYYIPLVQLSFYCPRSAQLNTQTYIVCLCTINPTQSFNERLQR